MISIRIISWFFLIYGALLVPLGFRKRKAELMETGLLFIAVFFLFYLSPFY